MVQIPDRLRDRAIVLLLVRLGLRAGDVAQLCLKDIDWNRGTLQVIGKGRYQVRLPLPQDVGEATLRYDHFRPVNSLRPSPRQPARTITLYGPCFISDSSPWNSATDMTSGSASRAPPWRTRLIGLSLMSSHRMAHRGVRYARAPCFWGPVANLGDSWAKIQ